MARRTPPCGRSHAETPTAAVIADGQMVACAVRVRCYFSTNSESATSRRGP